MVTRHRGVLYNGLDSEDGLPDEQWCCIAGAPPCNRLSDQVWCHYRRFDDGSRMIKMQTAGRDAYIPRSLFGILVADGEGEKVFTVP